MGSVSRFGVMLILGGVLIGACTSGGTTPGPVPLTVTLTLFPTVTPVPSATPVPRPPAPTLRPLAQPEERPVSLNEPVEATYTPGETRELYVFESDRARRISVEMAAADGNESLRLHALVFDAAGEIVPPVVETVGQPLLRDEWDLPGPGRYTVQVYGPEERPRTFTLTVVSRPVPDQGGGVIVYGETRSGQIAVYGQRDTWRFEGQAGDRVVITMTTFAGDAVLELYDPAGDIIAQNDDQANLGQNATIQIVLPVDGEYLLVARMYADDQTGSYQIRLALEQGSGSDD